MPSVVLITGASSGIGMLTAETAARAGHHVYATMRDLTTRNDRSRQALERLALQQKLSLRTLEMDVSSADSVNQAVNILMREQKRIDVVVNNAGFMSIGLAEGFTEEQMFDAMNVNFMGAFRISRAVLPHFRANRGGLLIHVTSIVGRLLFPGCGPYCASKFALEALAEILHYELAGTGVESVIVEPGPYPSHLLANSPAPADTERVASYGALSALRDNFSAHFSELFGSAHPPCTQDVADAIVRLIDSPAGARPLRTVCGMDFGADALNEQIAPAQAEVLRALGMEQMTPAFATNIPVSTCLKTNPKKFVDKLATRCARSSALKEACDRQIFIDTRPVNTNSATDEGIFGSFFRGCLLQSRKPGQWNRDFAPIG